MKHLKGLEPENAKLKRLYAEMVMENSAMKDLIEKKALRPPEKREVVRHLSEEHRLSVRAACRCVRLSRAAWYKSVVDWCERDRRVIDELSKLADPKPGLGFWKLFRRLRRQGHRWNRKRVYRVYCRLCLNRRPWTKRRLPQRDSLPLFVPTQPESGPVGGFDERRAVQRPAVPYFQRAG